MVASPSRREIFFYNSTRKQSPLAVYVVPLTQRWALPALAVANASTFNDCNCSHSAGYVLYSALRYLLNRTLILASNMPRVFSIDLQSSFLSIISAHVQIHILTEWQQALP